MIQKSFTTEAPASDVVTGRHTITKTGRMVLETGDGRLYLCDHRGDVVLSLLPEEASALGSIARRGGHLPPVLRGAKEFTTEDT